MSGQQRSATTRDGQEALKQTSGVEPVGSAVLPRALTGATNGPGVTWQIPSSVAPREMAPYPHITGPNPTAPADGVGRQHHLTTTQGVTVPPTAAFTETDAARQTRASTAAQWRLVERVHHPVLPQGRLGPAQHDQYLAIATTPGADGRHEVRSVTLGHDQRARTISSVDVHVDSVHQPVSPRTARR